LLNTDNKTEQWVEAVCIVASVLMSVIDASIRPSQLISLKQKVLKVTALPSLTCSTLSEVQLTSCKIWNGQMSTKKHASSPIYQRYYHSIYCGLKLLRISQSIAGGVEQYCRSVETLFLTEMYPRPTDYLQPQKSSAWLERARQLALTGEKKVEPFNFLPQSCVKLNNIEAARKLLDNMYQQIEADKVSEVLKRAPPIPEKVERNTFLFSVKIVIAENLVLLDGSPSNKLDTFVTLSDETGKRMAKTRTIYESLNPRCMTFSLLPKTLV
jgi:hypothetical protein